MLVAEKPTLSNTDKERLISSHIATLTEITKKLSPEDRQKLISQLASINEAFFQAE